MNRKLLNSTQTGKRVGLSAVALNTILYKKEILNKRGRPSTKTPNCFKPYWYLNELQFGVNIPDHRGGNKVRWYEDQLLPLFSKAKIGIYS